jgi:serine/threonine-protein kinase
MTPAPGASLLQYRLIEQIGEGGMGVVWRATDTALGRDAAIKFLPDSFSGDPERLARFEREAKLLASLSHRNIAAVYGLHVADGTRFLAMEMVKGEDLAERLKRGPLPVDDALAIARQIAEALETAHENGVIHRDLKPANVRVTADGTVKVLDFGLAKAFDTSPASGPDLEATRRR